MGAAHLTKSRRSVVVRMMSRRQANARFAVRWRLAGVDGPPMGNSSLRGCDDEPLPDHCSVRRGSAACGWPMLMARRREIRRSAPVAITRRPITARFGACWRPAAGPSWQVKKPSGVHAYTTTGTVELEGPRWAVRMPGGVPVGYFKLPLRACGNNPSPDHRSVRRMLAACGWPQLVPHRATFVSSGGQSR